MTSASPALDIDLPNGTTARLMVGLEVHVELATKTKNFTSTPNVANRGYFDAEPNTLCDPVVLGLPGVLPVINREAVEMSIRVGLALGCEIARHTKWDRKSYYYPDLPKNYQISQYDEPICGEGTLEVPITDDPTGPTKRVRIMRAHLEEDAGKLLHEAPGGYAIDYSIIDLNRAGTPLLEIVTHPDMGSPEEVVAFCKTLRDICRHLGVTEGILQRGQMRFEPNINVVIHRDGQTYKTPIVEVKNLNSFKAVYGSVKHEFTRQVEEWLQTGRVMGQRAKSTRGWDDAKGVTTHQRHKEDADEYRYFPDPDLVPLNVSEAWLSEMQADMPELPAVKRRRYLGEFGLDAKACDTLLDEPGLTRFYEAVLAQGADARKAAAFLLNTGSKRANDQGVPLHELGITPTQVKGILDLLASDKVGSSAAEQLFGLCCDNPEVSPEALANKHNLLQVSDTGALEAFVDRVLADPKNARAIDDLKQGKDKAIGALIGQIMKLSKGQANAKIVTELVKKKTAAG
ncbi:MAG: Asp-tRNA(Asn)/Glu-tRNA(Gln) amidotransferase subunit GatB [Phycisphaera sp.]|nr:Asp-tRNA(Asn)/Glu-tRNA(Gln) amidotransferase subunit GatB [Phycisphaera sp.]